MQNDTNRWDEAKRIYDEYAGRIKYCDAPVEAATSIYHILAGGITLQQLKYAIDKYEEKIQSCAVNRVNPDVFFGEAGIYKEYLQPEPVPEDQSKDAEPKHLKGQVKHICKNPECKEEFWAYEAGHRQYCSVECRVKVTSANTEHTCPACGQDFLGYSWQKYCSDCKAKYSEIYLTRHYGPKSQSPDKACQECGKALHRKDQTYCSQACASNAMWAKKKGKGASVMPKVELMPGDAARNIYDMYVVDFHAKGDRDKAIAQIDKALTRYTDDALTVAMINYDRDRDKSSRVLDPQAFFGPPYSKSKRAVFEIFLPEEMRLPGDHALPHCYTKECPECGKTFDTAMCQQIYCSEICAAARDDKNRSKKPQQKAQPPNQAILQPIKKETTMPEKAYPAVQNMMEALQDEFTKAPMELKIKFITTLLPQTDVPRQTEIYRQEYPEYLMPDLDIGSRVYHPYHGVIEVDAEAGKYLAAHVDGKAVTFDRNGVLKEAPRVGRLIFTSRDEYNAYMDEKEEARRKAKHDRVAKNWGNKK
jgi:hypothetical protein